MSLSYPTKFLIAAALVVSTGCGSRETMPGPDGGDAGTGSGGDAGGSGCAGQCAPLQPLGWDYPTLVWFGAEKDAPECPPEAPAFGSASHADLDAPAGCGTCTCSSPTGSCTLPATFTANAATCALNNASTPHTTFDPSTGWDGTCDANDAIPSGKLCSGVKCVQSLTIGPLTVNESACKPSPTPAPPAATWKTFARGCRQFPPVPCSDSGHACLPASPPGFRVCVFQLGDNNCPSGSLYTEKHVFYDDFQDTRACSPCSCSSPTGGSCSSTASVFTDGACSTLAYSATVTSAGPACHDLPAGTPLGSKSSTPPTYTPGACTPGGGEPMGAATPVQPSTYCCLPSP